MNVTIMKQRIVTPERVLLVALLCLLGLLSVAQSSKIHENGVVKDSVSASIKRELMDGLWAEAINAGELVGSITLDMVIDDKGRVESVFVKESDLPVNWKNAIKDRWFDRRFAFKLPKGHKEKIDITLQFP
ncbi:MAG TPA: hypothetical protein PK760_05430 [Flavobacteriales bacterium]|nr:hypothetical protein [Flavobacteriales bacterium]